MYFVIVPYRPLTSGVFFKSRQDTDRSALLSVHFSRYLAWAQRDDIMKSTWDRLLQWYAIAAYVGIVVHLLVTKRANLSRDSTGLGNKFQCIDGRIAQVEKRGLLPGGPAGLSSGLGYLILALLFPPSFLRTLCLAYFRLHLLNATIHSSLFVWQVCKNPPHEDSVLVRHTGGCGQAVASSLLWILYFIPGTTKIRDAITVFHEWQAKPIIDLLKAIFWFVTGYELQTAVLELENH